uniref:phospholipase A2 inhibitor and Ly6/PLAUR domain-containing protein-like n=1 Tax=Euleptes europaea TaxID=460621 RepID=UPI0025423434|nr:phospholipase A2 inhibitor and Ly6/PLAUR domain-containing protein-like [Euleptes europaea]
MMRTSIALFIFAVLVAASKPAFAIQCRTCSAVNVECAGTLRNCSSEHDTCGLIFTKATLLGNTLKTTRRSCTTRQSCVPGDIFMHLDNGYRETGSSICCTTDDCNAANFTVPVWNETLNGQQCPSCSVDYPNTCKQETINCMGSATVCFTSMTGSIIHRGCATRSFCANSFGLVITKSLRIVLSSQSIECATDGVPGLGSSRLYLQTFAGFLIAKAFF